MKVIAINGSSRKDGNTAIIIKEIFNVLNKEGIEAEMIQLAGHNIQGCIGCGGCSKSKNKKCCIKDDGIVNECIEKMVEADGIILASPVYFADVTSNMKSLIERAGVVSGSNGNIFKHKIGASVMAVRRGGAIHAFETMNNFLHYMQMYLVGGSYWNMVHGKAIGDVKDDIEGLKNMQSVAENMAWILKKINK